MSILLCWVVLPLALGLVALGCGLLVEVVSGFTLRGPLVPVVGLAAIIVVGDFATMAPATAGLATPLVVALAVCGCGLSLPRNGRRLDLRAIRAAPFGRRRVDHWAVLAAAAVYLIYAAPIVLSGSATFAGYVTLDDTATWLALTDHVMEHGRSLAGLAPSTYQVVLKDYLSSGYPLGSFIPLGVGGQLTGHDIAWLFQPTIAVLASMLSLSIYGLCGDMVASPRTRALVAFLGAQPALLFQYAFWSGIKEMAAATMLALICATFGSTLGRWTSLRGALPASVAVAALLAVLSVAGGFWLVIPALVSGVVLIRRSRITLTRSVPRLVGLSAGLSIPSLVLAYTFVQAASGHAGRLNNSGGLFGSIHTGNLGHALNNLQVLGIWPATDFRDPVESPAVTYVMFAVVGLAIVLGLALAWRRRLWAVPLYLAAGAGGFVLLLALGHAGLSSPWLDAKAMAEGSPAVLTAAIVGAAVCFQAGRRLLAVTAGLVIAAGVLWSNGLSYGNVWLAPRSQLAELETIGARFAGQGPALMTEFQPYGVRHFLRRLDPEGASERRARLIALQTGGLVAPGESADLDQFKLGAVLVYRTLVLRTSPVASRPPSIYRLVWQGRWYQVWQRPRRPRRILTHLSLGTALDPAGIPPCTDVLRLAAEARGAGGVLAAVPRPEPPIVAGLAGSTHPSSWSVLDGSLVPAGPGTASVQVSVPRGGTYELWIGGSFRRTLTVTVDGRQIGSASAGLNTNREWLPLADARLVAGPHTISLHYGGSPLAPGSGGFPFALGPLVLSTAPADVPVSYVNPDRARSLCGRRLDWLEAVGGFQSGS